MKFTERLRQSRENSTHVRRTIVENVYYFSLIVTILGLGVLFILTNANNKKLESANKQLIEINKKIAKQSEENGAFVKDLIQKSDVDHARLTKYIGCLVAALGRGEILDDPSLYSDCELAAQNAIPNRSTGPVSQLFFSPAPAAPQNTSQPPAPNQKHCAVKVTKICL